MDKHLTTRVKWSEAITEANGVAATTDINGAIIDMAGFEGVLMVVTFGTITATAVTSIKAQRDTDVAGGTMADIEGTAQTVADDDDGKTFMIDLLRPAERYVRVVVDRGTANAVVRAAYYLRYGAHEEPVSQGSLMNVELHKDRVEGTA